MLRPAGIIIICQTGDDNELHERPFGANRVFLPDRCDPQAERGTGCVGGRLSRRVGLFAEVLWNGDVDQWLQSQNSNPETLGSIPWRGRVNSGTLFSFLSVLVCT